jgi:hypothetical protein
LRIPHKNIITTEHRIGISANCIVTSKINEWSDGTTFTKSRKSLENLKDNKTKGQISKAAKTKMKRSINWLVISSTKKKLYSFKANQRVEFKVNFLTLTIPPQEQNQVSEKLFKQLLNTWLTYHRKYNRLNNYVWKCEKHKDGRLHCHIISDTFIHYRNVRESWNQILLRNGLLTFHFSKFGNYTPPSTDVKSVKKVKNLSAYMVKYMVKSNQKDELWSGRVWSCSLKISKVVQSHVYISPDKIGSILAPLLKSNAKSQTIYTEPNALGTKFEVAQIYFMKIIDWLNLKGSYLYDYFKELILYLRPQNAAFRSDQLIFNLT